MPVSSPRASSRRPVTVAATFLVGAVLALLATATAPPAAAHSELISSTPADGAQLEAPPAELVLEFNEDIQDLGTEVVVTAANEVDVTDGDPVVDGPRVTVPLDVSGSGDYTVVWRVVSADGHPISGELGFSATAQAEPTGEPSTTTSEATEETTTPEPTSAVATTGQDEATPDEDATQGDDGTDAAPVVIVVALVAAALLALVLVARRLRARRQRP